MTMLSAHELTIHIGKRPLVKSRHFVIRRGETWGILGPNGSGKTTLLHTLAGLHSPSQGRVDIASQSLHHLSEKERARRLGILFQNCRIPFKTTVFEYCLAARFPHLSYFKQPTAADLKIIEDALVQVDLLSMRNRNAQTLSGGELRRLQIASLLAQTPDFYLLDEPTNHLDISHQMHILTHLRSLAAENNKSIIMTMHDVNHVMRFCDHVILLFPDHTHIGMTHDLLTAENLSRLYQYPMQAFMQNDHLFWQPASIPLQSR